MKHLFAALIGITLCAALPALAQVYKTTDEEGRVIYSDRPSDSAEQVELKPTNSAPPIDARQRPEPELDDLNKLPPYQVRITSPQPGTTLTPGERDLIIGFEANQPLQPGLRFQLLSNGSPLGRSTTGNSITVPEIERGEHSLTVIIYDQNDRVLAESGAMSIYVHRTVAPKPSPRGG